MRNWNVEVFKSTPLLDKSHNLTYEELKLDLKTGKLQPHDRHNLTYEELKHCRLKKWHKGDVSHNLTYEELKLKFWEVF